MHKKILNFRLSVLFFLIITIVPVYGYTNGRALQKLLHRVISNNAVGRNSFNHPIRERMNALVMQRAFLADRGATVSGALIERAAADLNRFLDDGLYKVLEALPELRQGAKKANYDAIRAWRVQFEERLGVRITKQEMEALMQYAKLGRDARMAMTREVAEPFIEKWGTKLKDVSHGLWKKTKRIMVPGRNYLRVPIIAWGKAVNWAKSAGNKISMGIDSTYTLIRGRDGVSFTMIYAQAKQVAKEAPTHIRIAETGELIPLTLLEHSGSGTFCIADIIASPRVHRYVRVFFLRDKEVLSAQVIDLLKGHVITSLERSSSRSLLRDRMLALFRSHMMSSQSALAKIVNSVVQNFAGTYRLTLGELLVSDLNFMRQGLFRYKLRRFDFSNGVFFRESPTIELLIDFSNQSRPKITFATVTFPR